MNFDTSLVKITIYSWLLENFNMADIGAAILNNEVSRIL